MTSRRHESSLTSSKLSLAQTGRAARLGELAAALSLAAIFALLTTLLGQLPQTTSVKLGMERGPTSDKPFIYSFYTSEGDWPDGLFRWTRGSGASITIPGFGRRGALIEFNVLAHRRTRQPAAPPTILTLRPAAAIAAPQIVLRDTPAIYHIYLPPRALPDGRLTLTLDTLEWQPPGDTRDELGIALGGRFTARSVADGPVAPDLWLLLGYGTALLLLWAAMRAAGFAAGTAYRLLLPLAAGLPWLLLAGPARFGYGWWWAIEAGAIALLFAIAVRATLPWALAKLRAPAPPDAVRWLTLIMLLAITTKYSVRLFPDAMPGDIQLHLNRFAAMVRGQHYIDAQHRGLPFPFPTGLYLLLAPLTLAGPSARDLFPLVAGIFESVAALLLYAMLAPLPDGKRLGLVAAAVYTLTAGGSMTTWFAFFSHVSTQFFQLVLLLLLLRAWPRYDRPAVFAGLVALVALVALGHIGTLLNLLPFGALLVAALLVLAKTGAQRRAALVLCLAGVVAVLFAAVCLYSVYAGQFVAQLGEIASGKMVELTGKKPVPPLVTLEHYAVDGLWQHFGAIAPLLALPGAWLLWRGPARSTILLPLLAASAATSLGQAALPLLTQSSITTRWLMFSAWAIAVGAAPAILWLWDRGRLGRFAVGAAACATCYVTALVLAQAMTMRLPPVEPF